MSAIVESSEFHAIAPRDLVGGLLDQYARMRARVEALAETVASESAPIDYFLRGNNHALNGSRWTPTVDDLFNAKGAVAALNSDFWRRTLALTDVYECMPQARRDEWDAMLEKQQAPDFTEDAVVPTIQEFLALRETFLAERVDGLFRQLSGNHVTNQPQGFGKRMILEYVFNDFGSVQFSRSGMINDLRCVIAKFMGRGEPRTAQTAYDLRRMRERTGDWHTLDGGALRIRVYKKGTAHLEVHPDMAWRLNAILHHLHPRAIPASSRTKPAKRPKDIPAIQRPLPFEVLGLLEGCVDRVGIARLRYDVDESTPQAKEAARVLEGIGGVRTEPRTYAFDYNPKEAIEDIVMSGCVPDKVAHQYYPTPERIARIAVEMANIAPGHRVLEPSAGQGAIADLILGVECVELSRLHCKVLEAKGHKVTMADFMDWSGGHFDRIVMNPPYSKGRWQAHVERAARMADRVVAIVPASALGKTIVAGMDHQWSQVFEGEFAGTSMDVAIVAMERAA